MKTDNPNNTNNIWKKQKPYTHLTPPNLQCLGQNAAANKTLKAAKNTTLNLLHQQLTIDPKHQKIVSSILHKHPIIY
jgi:hypothetical protein